MASSDASVLPSGFAPVRSQYHATVEHVEDYETDGFSTGSSATPTLPSSRNSMSDLNIEDDDVEEIFPEGSFSEQ